MKWIREHCHIVTHPRFIDAGLAGRDLWQWGMLFSGLHELDGELPLSAVLASPWGAGGKRNVVVAQKLCEIGLWERTDTGFRILRWAEMGNQTKAQIEAKRREEREGRAERRAKAATTPPSGPDPVPCPAPDPEGCPPRTPDGVPYSYSRSGSDLGSLGGAGGAPPDPDIGTPTELPAWFSAAIATVEAQTGETLRPPDSWLRYSGHRAGKGIAKGQQDAVYWLTTVMVPEARDERQRAARQRERDAQRDRQRAGPGSLTDSEPVSHERQAAALAVLRERMAKRKGAA